MVTQRRITEQGSGRLHTDRDRPEKVKQENSLQEIWRGLEQSFRFLQDLHYTGPAFGQSSTELIKWMASATYERPGIDRKVKITVSAPRSDGMVPMLVHVSKGREGFYLTHWLKQVMKTDTPTFAEPCTSDDEIPAAIDKMGKQAEAIMTTSFLDVLQGTAWPHVVFDWGDYR